VQCPHCGQSTATCRELSDSTLVCPTCSRSFADPRRSRAAQLADSYVEACGVGQERWYAAHKALATASREISDQAAEHLANRILRGEVGVSEAVATPMIYLGRKSGEEITYVAPLWFASGRDRLLSAMMQAGGEHLLSREQFAQHPARREPAPRWLLPLIACAIAFLIVMFTVTRIMLTPDVPQ
jgi:hypothetical protein